MVVVAAVRKTGVHRFALQGVQVEFPQPPPGVVQQGVPAREPVGGFNQVAELFEHLPLPCGRVNSLQKGDGVPLLKGLFFRSHFHDKFLPNRF